MVAETPGMAASQQALSAGIKRVSTQMDAEVAAVTIWLEVDEVMVEG